MALLTSLDILNTACARIGEDPVDPTDPEAGAAAFLLYEEVVGFNLGVYPFTFGSTLRQLARVTGAQALTGYDFVFDLPPERNGPPIYITDDPTDPDRRFSAYALVEATVHSSAVELVAKIKFLPAPHLWSATFKTATVTSLAGRLAFSLASDRTTMDSLTAEAYGPPSDNFRGGQMRAAINEDTLATPPRRAGWNRNPLESAWRS